MTKCPDWQTELRKRVGLLTERTKLTAKGTFRFMALFTFITRSVMRLIFSQNSQSMSPRLMKVKLLIPGNTENKSHSGP